MSSDRPTPLIPRNSWTPSMQMAVLTFAVLFAGGWLLHTVFGGDPQQAETGQVSSDSGETVEDLDPAASAPTGSMRDLMARLHRIEQLLSGGGGSGDVAALARANIAVQRVRLADLKHQAGVASRQLNQLKELQSRWAAIEGTLLTSESGRRLANSPGHLTQSCTLWQRHRPTTEQLVAWERQLNALTQVIPSDDAPVSDLSVVTDAFVSEMSALQEQLKTQVTAFEEQVLTMESLQRETSALPPGSQTLAAAIDSSRLRMQQQESERMGKILENVRKEAAEARAKELARAEQQLADQLLDARKNEIERQRQEAAEQERVKQAEHEASLAGLKETTIMVQESLKWVRLEREMNRELPEIRSLLMAFLADGFQNRTDDKKGPASLSVIKGYGGLEEGRTGLGKLFFLACGNNDRPRGGMPNGVGGHINQETNVARLERAQQLLIKYGDLMVRNGMLAE